jgi:YD repeat-containing protein
VTGPFGQSLSFGYDADGNRVTMTGNQGGVQSSTYDGPNRLTSRRLSDRRGGVAQVDYTYTVDGRVDTVTRSGTPTNW